MGGGISLSSDNFDFDLNSILSEFTDSTDFSPETPSKADSSRISAEEDLMSGVFTEEHPVPGRPSAPQAKWHNPFSEETAVFTPVKDAVLEDGTVKYFSVAGGFLEMNGTKCTVLATVAEDGKDIDAARAEAAKKRAEERLASKSAEIDMNRATIALQKALTRLKTKAKVSG